MKVTKCAKCGRTVAKPLFWDGRPYGKDCWKQIALPRIEQKKAARMDSWRKECIALCETLKAKSMDKIRSQWKRQLFQDIIRQYEEEGWLSKKQYNLIYKQLNKQDKIRLLNFLLEIGGIDESEYHFRMHISDTQHREYHLEQYHKIERKRIRDEKNSLE